MKQLLIALLVLCAVDYSYAGCFGTSQSSLDKALIKAVTSANVPAMKNLIEHGANVNAKDREGRSALLIAASLKDSPVVSDLIEAGADLHATDKKGSGALAIACISQSLRTLKILLDTQQLNLDATNEIGVTPLMELSLHQSPTKTILEMVKELLNAGADVNVVYGRLKISALGYAYIYHNSDLSSLLVAHGADEDVAKAFATLYANRGVAKKSSGSASSSGSSGGMSDALQAARIVNTGVHLGLQLGAAFSPM